MGKIYVITSGKGGVGKTTTAVNLAAALNKFKEDVTIVDTNLTTPNIGLYFGAPIVPINLNHVLQGKAEIEEAIYEHESGIKIIPSSLSLKDLQDTKDKSVKDIIKELKEVSEHIILDSSAGLGEETRVALEAADEIIIVTNPNILSVTDSLKAVKLAEEMKKPVKGLILTRVKDDSTEMPIENIREMLEIPLLGIIPEDKSVGESLVKKNAVVHTKPKSRAARSYMDIAAKMLGKKRRQESLVDRFLSVVGLR
ncbi:AAA family ATPase [Candidatus Pacearchaeota archaeon]|nr:AAA family ATPase [Candidatus Pacearchaeota archaeon]